MPGQLEIRLPQADGGKTPARSVLTWVERALGISDEQHQQQGKKPYAVYAIQRGRDVLARITVATPEQLSALCAAAGERMSFNGEWVQPGVLDATFTPVELLLSSAPPRTLVRVTTVTPAVFSSGGYDDPVLTKARLFDAARDRWEALEQAPVPEFLSADHCEVYAVDGRSEFVQGHSLHRGWSGAMDLKLRGGPERLVAGNVLLAYAELWGIGKQTTCGAGQIQVRSHPKAGRA